MRFKMQFEAENTTERRHSGVVTGISDMDRVRWPGSKWRCLLVRWDDIDANRHSRVSPWEIEQSGSVSSSNSLLPGSKRNWVAFPSGKSEFMVPDGTGASDFGESLRSQKVLQVQENLGFNTLYDCSDSRNMHRSEIRHCIHGSIDSNFAAIGNIGRDPLVSPDVSCKSVGFGESFRSHKVLQGQEIFVTPSYRNRSTADETRENDSLGVPDDGPLLGIRSGWSSLMQGYSTLSRIGPSTQVSSPSSVLTFEQAAQPIFRTSRELDSSSKSSCRLFGFSLTEERQDASKEENMVQATSSLAPEAFLPHVGQQFRPKPPSVTNTIGSNCTKVSSLYAVRDKVFDISL